MRSAKRVPSSLSVFGQYRIPLIRTEDDAWAEFAMVDGMQRRASGADAAWAAGAPTAPPVDPLRRGASDRREVAPRRARERGPPQGGK